MSNDINIEEMAPQHALEIESEISLFKIAKTLGDSYGKINIMLHNEGQILHCHISCYFFSLTARLTVL